MSPCKSFTQFVETFPPCPLVFHLKPFDVGIIFDGQSFLFDFRNKLEGRFKVLNVPCVKSCAVKISIFAFKVVANIFSDVSSQGMPDYVDFKVGILLYNILNKVFVPIVSCSKGFVIKLNFCILFNMRALAKISALNSNIDLFVLLASNDNHIGSQILVFDWFIDFITISKQMSMFGLDFLKTCNSIIVKFLGSRLIIDLQIQTSKRFL